MARLRGDEVYPGQVILDASGNRVASSATIFPIIVAGGRAIDALRSITVAQHLFGIQNIVVVHHSYCGRDDLHGGRHCRGPQARAAHRHLLSYDGRGSKSWPSIPPATSSTVRSTRSASSGAAATGTRSSSSTYQ